MTTTNADGDDHTAFESLSTDDMLRVNLFCDGFERRWRQGVPSIPSFLDEMDAHKSSSYFAVLCLELIAIDIQHRYRLGHECSISFYTSLFRSVDEHDIARIYNDVVVSKAKIDDCGPLQIDQQIGDYVVKERIGTGGMGAVYRAEHRLMGRQVAIKILSGRTSNDSNSQRRFLREVRALAKLSHPNIIAAFDARIEGDLLYLVTEWGQGENLAQRVARSGPLENRLALELVLQAARGLHYAHTQGIVHRDVKPSNLLLDQQGVLKVLDLGLARLMLDNEEASSEALTQSMHLLGTVAYMAPEQARSPLSSNQRSDIYSLGCTLFFLLTGKPPYSGATNVDVLFSHARDPVPNRIDTCKTANMETARLLQSMLAKEPSLRPEDMREVEQRLERIVSSSDSALDVKRFGGSQLSQWKPWRRRWSRRTEFVTVLILTAIAISISLGIPKLAGVWSSIPFHSTERNDLVGINLNGKTSFGQIINFDVPVPNSALIEASFTAGAGDGPANLVTWTGDRILGLFIDQNNCWGVSFADGNHSYVSVSDEKAIVGKQQLIAARCEASTVRLYIDGRQVPSIAREYRMVATKKAFCFGGLPPGLLPLDVGTRFLSGKLHRLRVSTGNLPSAAMKPSDLLNRPGSTLALLQFSDVSGQYAVDESERKWLVRLNDIP